MGIYRRVKELYAEAERKNAEERARQQRETELWRDASKVVAALVAHGMKPADAPIGGWLLHVETLPPPPKSEEPSARVPFRSLSSRLMPHPETIRYQLGVDGKIYRDEVPVEHPTNATMDKVEQYLAGIVVKNHLDAELFKNDET